MISYPKVAFLLLALISCTKKVGEKIKAPEKTQDPVSTPKIDTIKPNDYLPAFPGSYWKYITDQNVTVTYTTSATYLKDSYSYKTPYGGPDAKTQSGTAYVPHYNGVPLWGYSGHTGPFYSYGFLIVPSLIPIVSEGKVGRIWTTSADRHARSYKSILTKDTTIQIEGQSYYPTIVIGEFSYPSNNLGVPVPTSLIGKEYYTKDIGLIKKETFYANSASKEMHLVTYHINK